MKKNNFFLIFLFFSVNAFAQFKFDKVLYGVATYYEYMPYERLDKDVQMMKDCGINVYGFKSGFCNENVQVRSIRMPGLLREACGFSYQQFSNIEKLKLKGDPFKAGDDENYVQDWAELIVPETAQVLAYYDHPCWGKYAAITQTIMAKGRLFILVLLLQKRYCKASLRDRPCLKKNNSIKAL